MAEWDEQLSSLFFDSPQDHMAVAHATRTLEDPDLHAVALYNCCGLPPSMLLSGNSGLGCHPLCTDDLTRCLTFQRIMPKYWSDLHYDLFDGGQGMDEPGCLGEHVCRPTMEQLREAVDDHVRAKLDSDAYHFLDLSVWEDLLDKFHSMGMCTACVSTYEKQLLYLRQGETDCPDTLGALCRHSMSFGCISEF